jgi:hypothetical protein
MCIKNTKTRTKIQSKGKVSAPQKMHSIIKKKFVTIFIQKKEQKFLAELKVLLSNYSNQASDANLGLGISKNGVLNICCWFKSTTHL